MRRRGLSLLEMTIVALILAAVTLPFLEGFGAFGRSMHRTTRQTSSIYLAQAIMEQVRRRMELGLAQPPAFAGLAEEATRVATASDGERSRYFLEFENLQGKGFHGISPVTDPELYQQLAHFGCRVEVVAGPAAGIDADRDGRPEPAMVEVGVTVLWANPAGGTRETTLWSVFGSDEPGEGS